MLVGFSSYARALKSKDLACLDSGLENPYTNMEEGSHSGQKISEPGACAEQADHYCFRWRAHGPPGKRESLFPVSAPSEDPVQDPAGVQEMRGQRNSAQHFHARAGCALGAVCPAGLQDQPGAGFFHHPEQLRPLPPRLTFFPRKESGSWHKKGAEAPFSLCGFLWQKKGIPVKRKMDVGENRSGKRPVFG